MFALAISFSVAPSMKDSISGHEISMESLCLVSLVDSFHPTHLQTNKQRACACVVTSMSHWKRANSALIRHSRSVWTVDKHPQPHPHKATMHTCSHANNNSPLPRPPLLQDYKTFHRYWVALMSLCTSVCVWI